jgi:DNA mismatch endonuclease (patch repair protein)
MDRVSKIVRSRVMAAVKPKNTKLELAVRSFLHIHGLRFRLHDQTLPGRPDLVFPKLRSVLFVNGCFWHGHPSRKCKLARLPKSNVEFWKKKITTNRCRDERNAKMLRSMGWKVITFWECELGKRVAEERLLRQLGC